MSAIYIISDNGKLGKKDETITFTQIDGTVTILFPFKTEILFVIGNVSVSGDALRMLSRYKIPVVFLSSNGRFNSKLTYGDSKNVFLRQKQYLLMSNPSESLKIAKSIVIGKIKNQISFMQRIKRKLDSENDEIKTAITNIKSILNDVEHCNEIESLRGYEGLSARCYFKVFAYNISCPWAVFERRSRNPPESNVNAVLSFIYTLLAYRVESALESQGLDVMAANLHVCDYGRSSLVFDIMEEFRTPIADSLCCSLFNLGTLREEDFEKVNFGSDNDNFPIEENEQTQDEIEGSGSSTVLESGKKAKTGILLTKDGIKKVLKAFEEKINSSVLYENEKISYQKIIIKQTQHYKRVVSGEELEYRSYYFK